MLFVYLLSLLLTGFVSDLDPEQVYISENGHYTLSLKKDLFLKENIRYQSDNLNRFAFDEKIIAMTSFDPAVVMVYNRETGEQIHQIGRRGSGPFEYRQIADVGLADNHIGILCKTQGLLLFDKSGSGVEQYPVKSSFSQHFALADSLLALRLGFHPEKELIEIWDLTSNEVIKRTGHGTDNDMWLQSMWHSGGLFFQGDALVYALADKLELHQLAYAKNAKNTFYFDNERYRRYSLDAGREEVQQDPMLMIDYVMDRSIIANVYPFEDGYIIEIDHRKLEEPFYSELMILNHSFEWIDSIVLDPGFSKSYGENSRAMHNGVLLYYNVEVSEEAAGPHKVSFFEIQRN